MCTSPFSPKKNAPKYEMLFFPHLKNRFSFSSVKRNNGHFEKKDPTKQYELITVKLFIILTSKYIYFVKIYIKYMY